VQIGVDIGGTFTDIVALDRAGRLALTKVPSTPKDCSTASAPPSPGCWRSRVASPATSSASSTARPSPPTPSSSSKGAVTAVLTTDGFEDVLELGRMKRSRCTT